MLGLNPPDSWTDWAAAIQIVQFVTVLIALIYAGRQAAEANRSRELQATLELFKMIGDEEIRELRRAIMTETDPDRLMREYADSGSFADAARKLAVRYDRICYLTRNKLLPESALFEFQRDEIIALWERLSPLIMEVRRSEQRPGYCSDFELIAQRAGR